MRAGWVDGAWTAVTRTSASVVDKATELSISPRVQYAIYATLFLIGLGMRLVRLGDQAVHHDESLHGYYGYQIAIGNEYEHSPLTHGMFLFELIAAMFFLFGDSEFTLRLGMVLFGSALIFVPLLLRKQLGDVGALLTSVMLTFSPALFYFSRFARNDILMAFFIAVLVVAMWRYVEEQRHRWLYITAAVLGFSMATKESAYIFVVIFAAYFAWATRYEIRDILLGNMKLNEISPQGHILVLLVGLTAPFYVAGIALFQDLFGLTLAAVEGTPGLATGAPDGSTATAVAAVLTLAVFGVGVAIGAWWNWRRFWVALAIFWAIYAVIMTNFGSHYPGVITGVWQSLGYWLAQQDVRRGDQPWYYYFIMGSVYEFLPMLTAMGVALYYAIRTGWRSIGIDRYNSDQLRDIDDAALHAVLPKTRSTLRNTDPAFLGVGIRHIAIRAVNVEHVEVHAIPAVLGVRDLFGVVGGGREDAMAARPVDDSFHFRSRSRIGHTGQLHRLALCLEAERMDRVRAGASRAGRDLPIGVLPVLRQLRHFELTRSEPILRVMGLDRVLRGRAVVVDPERVVSGIPTRSQRRCRGSRGSDVRVYYARLVQRRLQARRHP